MHIYNKILRNINNNSIYYKTNKQQKIYYLTTNLAPLSPYTILVSLAASSRYSFDCISISRDRHRSQAKTSSLPNKSPPAGVWKMNGRSVSANATNTALASYSSSIRSTKRRNISESLKVMTGRSSRKMILKRSAKAL